MFRFVSSFPNSTIRLYKDDCKVPEYFENTHEPSCSRRLTTLNDTGTSQQNRLARKAVGKAACQRNAEMLVRVYICREKKKGAWLSNCLWQRSEEWVKTSPPNQRAFPEMRATPKAGQLCCRPLSRLVWVGRGRWQGLSLACLCQSHLHDEHNTALHSAQAATKQSASLRWATKLQPWAHLSSDSITCPASWARYCGRIWG